MHNFEFKYYDKEQNCFIIRPINSNDKDCLRLGLKELSVESKRQRFQSGKTDFNNEELKYLTEVDQIEHMAYIVRHVVNSSEFPAGVIRGVHDKNRPNKVELAITIIDKFQNKGLGLILMDIMEKWALSQNYTHFIGDLHNSNTKMIKLLEKFSKNRGKLLTTHMGDGFLYFEVPLKK